MSAATRHVSESEFEQCRAAFVAIIKEENFMSDGYAQSLRQHWTGRRGGFADEMLQRRWRDFKAGWAARAEVEKEKTG